jgi:hypothetical protein
VNVPDNVHILTKRWHHITDRSRCDCVGNRIEAPIAAFVDAKSYHVAREYYCETIIEGPEQIRLVHHFVTRHEFASVTTICWRSSPRFGVAAI